MIKRKQRCSETSATPLFLFAIFKKYGNKRRDFEYLKRGLKQRVTALNCFIKDIYGEKKIVKDQADCGGTGNRL